MAANFLKLQAADEAWEELSGGLLGRIAQFEGVGGDSP